MCLSSNPALAVMTKMTSSSAVSIKDDTKKSAIAKVTNSPVMIKMDNSKPNRKPNTRKVSNHTNDPLGTCETTLPYTLSSQKSMNRASKRAKNTIVSYCNTINSDIEDKSIIADYESESKSEDEEVVIEEEEEEEEETKPSIVTKSSAATRAFVGTKPFAVTNSSTATKPSNATKPSATTK